MHFADDDDVVWGTGVNGKVRTDEHRFSRLDVRAVRGPRTRRWLMENKGLEVPEVYGDPALLLAPPEGTDRRHETRELTVIPNMNEITKFKSHPAFISPRRPVKNVLETIAASEVVVGSSLHAIVLAEAFGVPCALLRSAVESPFKYSDYFEGTNRFDVPTFDDFSSAVAHAKSIDKSTYEPLEAWDPTLLRESFPSDLWAPPRQAH
ncbi:polysaccharide pyruvyl transferase family protein [Frigoribacterium sp. PhB160]|uniref:polysaccharide pyruvyl transferase family protein n=1 Tax=Frigoribacterium sp. PhB160 TaxID=2485192 RepID=UPI0013154298|nr:polysaccharide pyruvyl transferase family protein [Frigoribacterium sp. PhB160]